MRSSPCQRLRVSCRPRLPPRKIRRIDRSGLGDRDGGQPVSLSVSRRPLLPHQSRLAQSEGEAARLSRAALLLYVSSAEALVRQAAVELGRPELRGLLADPAVRSRWPRPGGSCLRSSPNPACPPARRSRVAPWPQFAELLMLETSWVYPGPPSTRRAYYRSTAATATTSRLSLIMFRPHCIARSGPIR